MCKCKNIKFWSYDRQTNMKPPYSDKRLCIDTCLVQEIAELRAEWIRTTWCCCGHNKIPWYIWVVEEDIQKMKDLWYKVQHNPHRPKAEDTFNLKRWCVLCGSTFWDE